MGIWRDVCGTRFVQILRFAQDDRAARRCHPELGEGSVHSDSSIHSAVRTYPQCPIWRDVCGKRIVQIPRQARDDNAARPAQCSGAYQASKWHHSGIVALDKRRYMSIVARQPSNPQFSGAYAARDSLPGRSLIARRRIVTYKPPDKPQFAHHPWQLLPHSTPRKK